jgi:uncharacterized membrane protein
MTVILVAIGVVVCGLFFSSVVLYARERTFWRFVQLFGALCLVVVVLTHLAETFHLLPGMGWGLPNSAGHYLDLISAVLGLILFPLGYVSQALARRKNSK